MRKASHSPAAWALLSEGVASARVESHRLRHLLSRAMALVNESDEKDHLYEVAGDLIAAVPTRMDALDRHLDRTSYALASFGEDMLRDGLNIADRKQVDEAKETAEPMQATAARLARRVASRFADLAPPLGYPGGPCHVVERIVDEVPSPRLQDHLVGVVEEGQTVENAEANKIYKPLKEKMPTGLPMATGTLTLMPHAQYRMDLRGVTVPQVRVAVASFIKEWSKLRSSKHPTAARWEEAFARNEPVDWTDKTLGLTVVLSLETLKPVSFRLVTAYWKGEPDERPPSEGCAIPKKGYQTPDLSGYRTFVDKPNAEGFAGWSKEKESVLPPGSATPGSAAGTGRSLPGMAYNGPEIGSGVPGRSRTTAVPGELAGSPVKYDYGTPTRRSMTARKG